MPLFRFKRRRKAILDPPNQLFGGYNGTVPYYFIPPTGIRMRPETMPKPLQRSGLGGKRLALLESRNDIASSQPNSRLMSLPPELRDRIWKEHFAAFAVNLIIDDSSGEPRLRRYNFMNPLGLLGVVLCCRHGYIETIKMLYAHVKFSISEKDVLLCLPSTLMPQHLRSIGELTFLSNYEIWETPSEAALDNQRWLEIWKILASLTGLKKLRVEIPYLNSLIDLTTSPHTESLQQPRLPENIIKKIRAPKVFDLVLCWNPGHQVSELPCRVFYSGEEVS